MVINDSEFTARREALTRELERIMLAHVDSLSPQNAAIVALASAFEAMAYVLGRKLLAERRGPPGLLYKHLVQTLADQNTIVPLARITINRLTEEGRFDAKP